MIVNGFTHLGEAEISRHELSFQGLDLRGNIIRGACSGRRSLDSSRQGL